MRERSRAGPTWPTGLPPERSEWPGPQRGTAATFARALSESPLTPSWPGLRGAVEG